MLNLDTGEGADENGGAPLLSVFGGKITTHRKLAEHAMEKLARFLPDVGPAWTAGATLPGGDFPAQGFDALVAALAQEYPDMPRELLERWVRAYGTCTRALIGEARSPADLGRHFGGGLYEAEAAYLVRNEWARSAEDILARRSKLLLHVPADTAAALDEWFAEAARQSR